MKIKASSIFVFLLCSPLVALAGLDDDLFYSHSTRDKPVVRSLAWKGKTYGNIRIMRMEGDQVTLYTQKGEIVVPFDHLPKLWQDAMHRRNWPIDAKFPVAQPGFKTVLEWERARSKAEMNSRKNVAAERPGDYSMQLFLLEDQMKSWDKLYPRPVEKIAAPTAKPVPNDGLPAGPSADDAISPSHAYWKALTMAELDAKLIAYREWPNTPDRRAAKSAAVLRLWHAKYPAPPGLAPRESMNLPPNPFDIDSSPSKP